VKIHLRGYAYPTPTAEVKTRCSRVVPWKFSTVDKNKSDCTTCLDDDKNRDRLKRRFSVGAFSFR
jgi:hypothetical protein